MIKAKLNKLIFKTQNLLWELDNCGGTDVLHRGFRHRYTSAFLDLVLSHYDALVISLGKLNET
jgi:hypothetical protein